MKIKNGFTIAEILVVIAIVAIVGTIMVAIFISTLRGSNKSQILAAIKQNGQAVLENMDKNIRGADNVICPKIPSIDTSAYGDTLVIEKAGTYTRFRITLPTSTANGLIQQDSPVPPLPPAPESDIQFFLDNVCMDPLAGATTLTDTNTQSGVSANGLFTRSKLPGAKDNVTVEFTLSPGIRAPAAVAGQIDPVKFQTTVGLR